MSTYDPWKVDYYQSTQKDDCKSNKKALVFGRSLGKNFASLFGFGHAVDYNNYGDTDITNLHQDISNKIEKQKWNVIQTIFDDDIKKDDAQIQELNNLLQLVDDQVYYFENIYDPQFADIDMIDNFRITLLFTIIFVLITFIDWK
jgi:hypothetical protein